jgi:hypothetical protein
MAAMTSLRPTTGFWITVAAVAVLVAYPLSFGPACSVLSSTNGADYDATRESMERIFFPVLWASACGPKPVRRAIKWYGCFWLPRWRFLDFEVSTPFGERYGVYIKNFP